MRKSGSCYLNEIRRICIATKSGKVGAYCQLLKFVQD